MISPASMQQRQATLLTAWIHDVNPLRQELCYNAARIHPLARGFGVWAGPSAFRSMTSFWQTMNDGAVIPGARAIGPGAAFERPMSYIVVFSEGTD